MKGIDPAYSKKSQGVYLKTQAVLESKNGKNVVFATGTPISNTAAEIWTFMRYLMPADTMREYGIYYFDDFVRNFGNIQQMLARFLYRIWYTGMYGAIFAQCNQHPCKL